MNAIKGEKMKLSVVVPLFNQAENIYSFIDEVDARAQNLADEREIILTTNQEFEFVEKLHDRLKTKVHIIAVRESDDYQQVVMAGVDRASGDATIIMTPEYDPALMDDMVSEWRAGKEIVCLRRKHGKFGKFITKLRLKIYNLFLFMFGDIFSIGILKDAQLLDKKIVDKMKSEQDLAHRIRTMYAPLDYNTAVFNIEHPIEKFETKGTPKFDFWLGAIGTVITLVAMLTAFALAWALRAPIWFWTTVIIFGLIFEFVFIALLVNATARVKIGILHNMDEQGRIYNAAQEYYKDEELASTFQTTNAAPKVVAARKTKASAAKPDIDEPAKAVKKTTRNADAENVETKAKTARKKTTKPIDKDKAAAAIEISSEAKNIEAKEPKTKTTVKRVTKKAEVENISIAEESDVATTKKVATPAKRVAKKTTVEKSTVSVKNDIAPTEVAKPAKKVAKSKTIDKNAVATPKTDESTATKKKTTKKVMKKENEN